MSSAQVLALIAAASRDRAKKLDLSGQKLTKLPDSIWEIESLLELDLSNNELTSIPDAIASLSQLINLDLSSNNLEILTNSICSITNLHCLNLKSNSLKTLPENIGDLTQLRSLNICFNPLSRLPESIGNLVRLTRLSINKTRRTSDVRVLPESIEKLVNLKELFLPGCQLTKIPASIWTLPKLRKLNLHGNKLTFLPDDIANLTQLIHLTLTYNQIAELPQSMSKLTNLTKLDIRTNPLSISKISFLHILPKLVEVHFHRNDRARYLVEFSKWKSEWVLDEQRSYRKSEIVKHLGIDRIFADLANISEPFKLSLNDYIRIKSIESIGKLVKLTHLSLCNIGLRTIPNEIGELVNLKSLKISDNKISELPADLGRLSKLKQLDVRENAIDKIPESVASCEKLTDLDLSGNPIEDLSVLQKLPALQSVWMFGIRLPRRYWTKFSEWKAEWLLDETNAEIRRRLIELVGYEKICDELGAIAIDSWQEYTLLKIDNIQIIYQGWREVGREPMMLLKMTCPSTAHVHILRVPPEITSAEAAIVWVNHGIHPSQFSVQT